MCQTDWGGFCTIPFIGSRTSWKTHSVQWPCYPFQKCCLLYAATSSRTRTSWNNSCFKCLSIYPLTGWLQLLWFSLHMSYQGCWHSGPWLPHFQKRGPSVTAPKLKMMIAKMRWHVIRDKKKCDPRSHEKCDSLTFPISRRPVMPQLINDFVNLGDLWWGILSIKPKA